MADELLTRKALYEQIWKRYGKPEDFVANLKGRMREHRISQGKLAKKAGFAEPHVSRWIGKNPSVQPGMETMVMLDEALDLIVAEQDARRAAGGGVR